MDNTAQQDTIDPFLNEVVDALSKHPKALPCKYFYDERGSRLFTEICMTPEYYVTRTELLIMQESVKSIAKAIGPSADIVEFGSGAGEKIRLLLRGLSNPNSYTPMDISGEILQQSATQLRQEFPKLSITPVQGDYTQPLNQLGLFKNKNVDPDGKQIVYFPGSTLSNFTPNEARDFLHQIKCLIGHNGGLLIGIDLIKPKHILDAAYNDAQGYTAAFNLNMLRHINRELGADFDENNFRHHAFYNAEKERIEMHLISQRQQTVNIAGDSFVFEDQESIHTENSYKYSISSFTDLAQSASLQVLQTWTDEQNLFSVHYLEPV